jgi:hypothetical protein
LREATTSGLETVLQGALRDSLTRCHPAAANLRRMSTDLLSRPDGRAVAGVAV